MHFVRADRRGGQDVEHDAALLGVAAETERARWAHLHAGRATHAFGILHRHALVGEIHDVDALMTDRRADVARDAFLLVGENAKARETRVDVHERGERASEAAPDAAAEPEVTAHADDAGQ